MEWVPELEECKVICYHNGYRKKMSVREAYELFWRVFFGWILKTDWYRSGEDGKSRSTGWAGKTTGKPARRFAFSLLTRGSLYLQADDPAVRDDEGEPPGPNEFSVKAYRFGKLFGPSKPHEYTDVLDGSGRMQAAYRMKPGYDWLIVVDLDDGAGGAEHEFPWFLFTLSPAVLSKKMGNTPITFERLIDIGPDGWERPA